MSGKFELTNFAKVTDYLKKQGLRSDDFLVVHSSFSSLKKFGLSPAEMNDILLQTLGPKGKLAMPAIPIYPNELEKNGVPEAELVGRRYKAWTYAAQLAGRLCLIKCPLALSKLNL